MNIAITLVFRNHLSNHILILTTETFLKDCKINHFLFENIFVLIILQNDPIKLGNGQFGCPFCNRTMTHLASMKRHIMIHTGEKPFSCLYCDYSCVQKVNLRTHIKSNHENIS